MSRVAPSSSAVSHAQRVKANWIFDEAEPQSSAEFSATYGRRSQPTSNMTNTLISDANSDATPWWHESATLPSQPILSRDSPNTLDTGSLNETNDDHDYSGCSDEDRGQLSSGLQKKWRRPSAGLNEAGVSGQDGRVNGREQFSQESTGRRSGGSEMTPLQYTINCSPEATTSMEDCTNDGVDSGLGSATALFDNQEIVDFMKQHLMHYMNPKALLPLLQKHHLLTDEDANYIESPHRSDGDRKDRILSAILLQEGDSMDRLIDCLSVEKSHSGHKYLARRLREAVEKKKQHPDKPLSSLRLGTPSKDSIKPRGAAQRNSISRLLATKKNNVANIISRIEAKESSDQAESPKTQHQPSQPQPNQHRPSQPQPSMPQPNKAQRNKAQPCVHHTNHSPSDKPQSSLPQTNQPQSGQHQPSLPPTNQPRSDQAQFNKPNVQYEQTARESSSSRNVMDIKSSVESRALRSSQSTPSKSNSAGVLTTNSYLPSSVHCDGHTHSPEERNLSNDENLQSCSTPPHHNHSNADRQRSTPPHSLSSPQLPSSPRPFASCTPPFSSSQEDAFTNFPPSPNTIQTRRRPVNEVKILRKSSSGSTPPTSPHLTKCNSQGSPEGEIPRKKSSLVSEAHAQSPKIPLLPPSIGTRPHIYSRPSTDEETLEDDFVPSPQLSPQHVVVESLERSERTSDNYRSRATRLIGLGGRFNKHRRSASMTSRSSQREPVMESEGGWVERTPFHTHSRGKGEPSHQVRASLREGNEKLIRRRLEWLQERVHFSDCPEHIQFKSKTHYGEQRELLYSGTLHKHGKARFVVLFIDILLVLKARRPSMQSKLGGVFHFQTSRIDWFSDLEYTARKPLPLHLLTVKQQSGKYGNDTICLHFNDSSKVTEVVLQAVSKEARDIWVDDLSEAIKFATSAHADSYLLVGNKAVAKSSGEPYKKLQLIIHSASHLGLAANCNSFSLFCVIELGKQRCRTPSVMGGYNPSWEFKCEFTNFNDTDSLLVDVFSENIFRPNDFLGCVNIPLQSLPEEHSGRKMYEGSMVLAGMEEACAGEIEITIEQGWETKM